MMILKTILALGLLVMGFPLHSQPVIREDSIKGNILRETVKYSVYLPHKDVLQKENVPVLYLLHGLGHIGQDWLKDGQLPSVWDELQKDGNVALRDMVIVMPSSCNRGSGFFDVEGQKYESFFFQELLPEVERKYHAGGSMGKRAIGGFSMGGGAAVVYALKHPDMFSSVYAMSALVALPEMQSGADMDRGMFEFGRSVLSNDCAALLSFSNKEKVRKIAWFLDCGDEDFLLDANTRFHRKMKKLDVPCDLRVRDGGHNWEYWRSALYLALPFFSQHFSE